jgi:hypothetical protein
LSHFLHIGPARCATTWQARVFSEHPALFVPPSKDTEFFSQQYTRGEAWYRQQFAGALEGQLQGELCHRYFWHPGAPERAQQFNPQFRIIMTLRDPFERILSAYQYDRSLYLRGDVSLSQYLKLPVVAATNDYVRNVRRWQGSFSAEQVLICFYESIAHSQEDWLKKIWVHLGVAEHWDELWKQPLWCARTARVELVAHFAFSVSQLLRKNGFFQIVGRTKNQTWVERALFKTGKAPLVFSRADLSEAYAIVTRIYDDWEQCFGSLPEGWRRPHGLT